MAFILMMFVQFAFTAKQPRLCNGMGMGAVAFVALGVLLPLACPLTCWADATPVVASGHPTVLVSTSETKPSAPSLEAAKPAHEVSSSTKSFAKGSGGHNGGGGHAAAKPASPHPPSTGGSGGGHAQHVSSPGSHPVHGASHAPVSSSGSASPAHGASSQPPTTLPPPKKTEHSAPPANASLSTPTAYQASKVAHPAKATSFEALPLEKVLAGSPAATTTKVSRHATTKEKPPSSSLAQLGVALLGVLALILTTFKWGLPWLQQQGWLPASTVVPNVAKALGKVRQILPLGNNKVVYVLEVLDKVLVVGGANNQLQLLSEITVPSEEAIDSTSNTSFSKPSVPSTNKPVSTKLKPKTNPSSLQPTLLNEDDYEPFPPLPLHTPSGTIPKRPPKHSGMKEPHLYIPPPASMKEETVLVLPDYDDEY